MLVAAGGTHGHLAPALVVADELRARGHSVSFVGSTGPVEAREVPALGFPLRTIAIGGLPRRIGVAQLRAIARAVLAVFRARKIVGEVAPDVVLAGGGYVAAPVAIAAWLKRVPVVATEADAHLGLANRISARFARVLCSAYPLRDFRSKQQVTGRPVSEAFATTTREEGRKRLGLPESANVLAVVGGSGGATHLSAAVFDAFARDPMAGGDPIHVVHVVGHRDFPDFEHRARDDRYTLLEYCSDMPALFAAADLVVSRAGGSVFELAAAGRAAVLVPFPHATGDHQTKNADHFASQGAAVLLSDSECSPERLRSEVAALLGPGGDAARHELERAIARLARPDAATSIATAVEEAAQ